MMKLSSIIGVGIGVKGYGREIYLIRCCPKAVYRSVLKQEEKNKIK